VHSRISNGGELAPAQLVVGAEAAGLDFIATTEHNTAEGHDDPGWTLNGDLLVILGQEATTHSGHWLALGVASGQVIGGKYGVQDGALGEQLHMVRRGGGLSVVAHPFAPYPTGTFMHACSGFDVVEVWNGQWASSLPWQADNEAALSAWARSLADGAHGEWLPAMGNSDTHLAGQIGHPHTVVLAEELRSEAVLAGIRSGRSWIAASHTVEVSFTVSAGRRVAGIGEQISVASNAPVARVEVRGVPSGVLSIHTEHGRAYQEGLPAAGTSTVVWNIPAADAACVRVEVRDENGEMAALTNPIFLHNP
jgi:predicted metal-dependent phosphoesterase TrpH